VSAYQDFCELFARARERAQQRRQRFAAVFEQAGSVIVKHLGVPDDAFAWCPLELEPEEEPSGIGLAEAMSSDEEGAWHVGLRILLRAGSGPATTMPLVIDLRAQEEDGRLLLSFSDDEPRFRIHPDRPADFEAVAIDAERRLRAWLAENLDRVLGAAGQGERFGQYL
jgi:hypothetical protein